MVNGQWSMVNSQWSMVNGQWSLVVGRALYEERKMDLLLETLNISFAQLIGLGALGVVLLVAWLALRFTLRLTATLFRLGCAIIVLIVVAGLILANLT
jgi:hypothetical protein